jgi:triosephosphate isomerase
MRTPLIAANWKMNKTIAETAAFFDAFLPVVRDVTDVDIIIAPRSRRSPLLRKRPAVRR